MARWTVPQLAYLTKRWNEGAIADAIADEMAARGWPVRTNEALLAKRFRLNLPKRPQERREPREPREPKPIVIVWDADRVSQARELVQRFGPRAAARKMNVTLGALSGALWRAKNKDRRRSP